MGFDPNIKRAVRILAKEKEKKLKEREIYTAPQTARYFSGLSGTMQKNAKAALDIEIVSAGRRGITACTNGNRIIANWEHELFSRYATPEARFEAFSGGFFHEMAHVLYMDFNEERNANSFIQSGRFYGAEPLPGTAAEQDSLDKLKEAMAEERLRPLLRQVWNDLDNVIADRHDEDALMECFGGLVTAGIFKVRESLHSTSDPYEEMLKEGADALTRAYSAILQYSRFGSVFMYEDSLWDSDEVLKSVKECTADIDDAAVEDNIPKRYGYINRIVLRLWPFIAEELEKAQDEQESGDGGEGPTDEQLQRILEELMKASENMSSAPAPEKRDSSDTAAARSRISAAGIALPGGNSTPSGTDSAEQQSSEAMQKILQNITGNVAMEKAEKELEKEMAASCAERISTVNMCSSHKNIPLRAQRYTREGNEKLCEELTVKLKPYTARAVRQVEEALKDLSDGGVNRHRQFGRIIDAGESYRPDGRYFANRKLPDNPPDMAISILADNSGSMSGSGRIEAVREAALLVYDFATELNIPVCVCGHSTDGDAVTYVCYSDYERINRKDRSRIAAMQPSGCNRDGMALEISANLLSKRPEACKLLFIISDGQPNHNEYGGTAAAEDIRSIVRRYRKRGVEIIAAAIGSDREQIRGIYGEGFLDVSDTAGLPKSLAHIIRKRVMEQIG